MLPPFDNGTLAARGGICFLPNLTESCSWMAVIASSFCHATYTGSALFWIYYLQTKKKFHQ